MDTNRSTHHLAETVDAFQEQKLKDLRVGSGSFVSVCTREGACACLCSTVCACSVVTTRPSVARAVGRVDPEAAERLSAQGRPSFLTLSAVQCSRHSSQSGEH